MPWLSALFRPPAARPDESTLPTGSAWALRSCWRSLSPRRTSAVCGGHPRLECRSYHRKQLLNMAQGFLGCLHLPSKVSKVFKTEPICLAVRKLLGRNRPFAPCGRRTCCRPSKEVPSADRRLHSVVGRLATDKPPQTPSEPAGSRALNHQKRPEPQECELTQRSSAGSCDELAQVRSQGEVPRTAPPSVRGTRDHECDS